MSSRKENPMIPFPLKIILFILLVIYIKSIVTGESSILGAIILYVFISIVFIFTYNLIANIFGFTPTYISQGDDSVGSSYTDSNLEDEENTYRSGLKDGREGSRPSPPYIREETYQKGYDRGRHQRLNRRDDGD